MLFRAKNLELDRIIFFGSQIANKADKESDIDIIAVSRNFRGKDIFRKIEMADGISAELVKMLHKPVDLLYYSDKEWKRGSIIADSAKNSGIEYVC